MSQQQDQKPTEIHKFMVKKAFGNEMPTKSNFEIVKETLPPLKSGQFLVKAEYISVDPYLRSFARSQKLPYLQFAFQVGKVIESKNNEYPVGLYVVSHSGWSDFVILDGKPDKSFKMKPYEPKIGSLSLSLAIGALGMPGMTAYLGLLEICKPNKGDVVCVTSACGAVGSLVGQIARLKECIVIGFAGTDQKVKILKEELGFHHAFNYKTTKNIPETLKSVAPKGINCYFDNVGGNLAEQIMKCLAQGGRVACCGSISEYNEKPLRQKTSFSSISAHIEAFSFTQWDWQRQCSAVEQLREWIEKGNIIVKETITNGFENLPDSFIGLLKGENIGKAVVKI